MKDFEFQRAKWKDLGKLGHVRGAQCSVWICQSNR
jgi:hypothetical protein